MFKIHYVSMKAQKLGSINIEKLEFIASKDSFILNSRIHEKSNKLEGLKVISNISKLAVYEMALSKDSFHWVI